MARADAPRSARYALTRLALVDPDGLHPAHAGLPADAGRAGRPDHAALGGQRLAAGARPEQAHAAGYDKPILVQYGEYLGDVVTLDFGTTLTDNRPVTTIIVENGAATLELTFCGVASSRSSSGSRSAWSRGASGTRRIDVREPAVRDPHLRGPGVLPRASSPSSSSAQHARAGYRPPAARARSSEFDAARRTPTSTSIDSLIDGDWDAFGDVLQAPDPAGGHARAGHQRRVHPAGPGQPDADDAGRLRRGGAGARRSASARSSTTTPSATRWSR